MFPQSTHLKSFIESTPSAYISLVRKGWAIGAWTAIKTGVCVCISYGSLSSLWFPSVRNGKAKFLRPSHASTRRERTRHTCSTFTTRHSSSAEREASRGNRARAVINHLKNWAWPPQLFSVSEGIKLQNLEKSELQGKPAA